MFLQQGRPRLVVQGTVQLHFLHAGPPGRRVKVCLVSHACPVCQQVLDQRENAAMIFIMPPSLEELERRLRLRNTESEDALGKRLARAEEEISDVRGKVWRGRRQFDYVIVNDSVERASEELADVIGEIRRNDEQAHD